MGGFVFLIAYTGAAAGPAIAKSLRKWGHRIQRVSGWMIAVVGSVLIYSSFNPGFIDNLILK